MYICIFDDVLPTTDGSSFGIILMVDVGHVTLNTPDSSSRWRCQQKWQFGARGWRVGMLIHLIIIGGNPGYKQSGTPTPD